MEQKESTASASALNPSYDKPSIEETLMADEESGRAACSPVPQKSSQSATQKMAYTIAVGVLFGWGLQKSGVFQSQIIRQQFLFERFDMLIVFLTASALSTLIFATLLNFQTTRDYVNSSGQKHLTSDGMGLTSIALGTFLLGIGMAVSGACPGTVYAQLGSGNARALAVLAGGVCGAFVHGILHSRLRAFLKRSQLPTDKRTAYQLLHVNPLITAAATSAMFVAVIVCVLVWLWEPRSGTYSFFGDFWHPVLAGLLIGGLQLPLTLGATRNLGASTSMSVAAANIAYWYTKSEYLNKFKGSLAQAWQLLFVGAMTAGSAISAATSGAWYTESDMGVPVWQCFVGGFILLFGSRLANGCTSGHGLTGVGHQALASFIGVASMFAGGIATSYIFYY